jgi:hypothetical protein
MSEVPGFTDVLAGIALLDDEQLDAVFAAAKTRASFLRSVAKQQALATIKVGDIVKLDGLRPKYLNGMTGMIRSRKGDKFEVTMHTENASADFRSRFQTAALWVPASCLTVV